jgi:signal peptidase I
MRTAIHVQRLRWLSLVLGMVLAVRQWVWMPGLILGGSMQPTLRAGQIVGVNKLAYHISRPQRGEIIEVWNGKDLLVKRILGLPGEIIAIHDGFVYVNGAPLMEPYVQYRDGNDIAPGRLGPDCFLIAGDYRPETIIAVVNRNRIVGRVMHQKPVAQVAVIAQNP